MSRVLVSLLLCLSPSLPSLAYAAPPVVLCNAQETRCNRLPLAAKGWHTAGMNGIRGATVGPIESSLWPDRGYASPDSLVLLDELVRLGVTWISVTPFGRLWSLDSTEILLDFEEDFAANRRNVIAFIRAAHARGIRVLLIPHLWIETEGWRGHIDPGSRAGWDAYQRSYARFVLTWAEAAEEAGAEAFSIGVECKSWSGRFGAYWQRLIKGVRQRFAGLLTYSANWDEAADVLFWDQLDLIGVNAFYPLADHDGASYEEYVGGAMKAKAELAAFAETLQMPVLFVEIGYTTRPNAAVEPWLWPDDMSDVEIDEQEQARAMAALFEAFLPEPWFVGFFVWRYYASLDDVSQEHIWGFSPHGKQAEQLLSEVYGQRWAVDARRPTRLSKY